MRIAQITDLHLRQNLPGTSSFGNRRSRSMARLFEIALAQVRAQNVDLVAVTGDLLDVPLMFTDPVRGFAIDAPDAWKSAAIADYRLIKRLLDDSGLRYMVLPGNHELADWMWEVFDPRENVIDVAGVRVARFCDYEYEGHVPRRFAAERERWEALLNDTSSLPQVHLQHYIVTPPLNEGYPHTYAEGEEIARRTGQCGKVKLSLFGHYHKGVDPHSVGDTLFAGAPAFCVAPFPWRVFDVSHQGVTSSLHSLGMHYLPRRRAVFLDRDGVLSELGTYRYGVERMNLVPGAAAAVKKLNDAGLAVIVVSNQSAIGYGYVPEPVVASVNDHLMRLLAEEGATIDAIYVTIGGGDRSVLPKYAAMPKDKSILIPQAAQELNLDLTGSVLVGDRVADIEAARKAGLRPLLVRTGHGRQAEQQLGASPDVTVVNDLSPAVDIVLSS